LSVVRNATGLHSAALWSGCNVGDADCLGAAFIAVIVCVLGGVVAVIRGAWFGGALLIFIFAPAGYGQHVALGMAIRYAEGEN
jgi:hypothetical protein